MRSTVALANLTALAVLALAPSAAQGVGTERADFGVTVSGPSQAKVGERPTYVIALSNAGPDETGAKLRFAGGLGAVDTTDGKPLRTISATATQGTCKRDGSGVICRPGDIAPGATVTIEVVVEVLARDLPRLEVQATVQAEKTDHEVDSNRLNDHVELITPIPAPITLKGLPDRCARGAVVLEVTTKVVGAKRTKLIVDHKVRASTAGRKLKAKLDAAELGSGTHEVSVVAQAAQGRPPLATLKASFKSCT